METALLTGLQQQASQGAIPPDTLARIMRIVRTDKMELAEAITKVQEEAFWPPAEVAKYDHEFEQLAMRRPLVEAFSEPGGKEDGDE